MIAFRDHILSIFKQLKIMHLSPEEAFNKQIAKMLKEQPFGSARVVIKIAEKFPGQKSYYALLDNFAYGKLRIGFGTSSVFKGDTDRHLGYIPLLKYYPDNPLGENPRDYQLINDFEKPLGLDKAYALIAKELVYRIAQIPNLDELLCQ